MVNAAFDELECNSPIKDRLPCGGGVAAYCISHPCITDVTGYRCANHYRDYLENALPKWRADIIVFGGIWCAECGREFRTTDAFSKFVPL